MASIISAGTTSNTALNLSADTTGILQLASNGSTTALTIDTSQNVGIGTNSPATKLVVKGTHQSGQGIINIIADSGTRYSTLSFTNNTTQKGIVFHDNTDSMLDVYGAAGQGLRFTTNDAERMRITSAGDVGIGTSSPAFKLQVAGGDLQVNRAGTTTLTLVDVNNAYGTIRMAMDAAGVGYLGTVSPSLPLAIYTANTERMRIDSSGSLLLGVSSSPLTSSMVLYFDGFSRQGLLIKNTANSQNGAAVRFMDYLGNVDGGGIYYTSSNSISYTTSSDYRLKENIAPMTGALEKVTQLKPCTFQWTVDGSDGQGFIAHELQEVIPNAVVGEKDAVDAEGNPRYQGVDTSFLVATLTAAIQELKAELDATKAEVQALKGVN